LTALGQSGLKTVTHITRKCCLPVQTDYFKKTCTNLEYNLQQPQEIDMTVNPSNPKKAAALGLAPVTKPNPAATSASPELNDTQLDTVVGGFGGGIESAQLGSKGNLQRNKKLDARLLGDITDNLI
jgi:hypothetical protein